MATRTSSRKPVAPVDVAPESVKPEPSYMGDGVADGQPEPTEPVSLVKPSAHDRLTAVLAQIDKATAKPLEPADVKWGKAIGLLGGGSVYINRSNADVRSTTKQVADWAKSGLGVARGPQGQYLRISF